MLRIVKYLREGIWERDLRTSAWPIRLALGTARVILTVLANIERHRVGTSAGSLTVTTLLALVPLGAAAFSVARGFGFGDELDSRLTDFAAELPEHFQDVIYRVRDLIAAVEFGKLGALSSLVVLYTGMSLFVRVERSINHAWEASAHRSWLRRLSDFVMIVVFVPLLALGAMALGSLVSSADSIDSLRSDYPGLAWLYVKGLGFLPHLMLGAAFTALYKFMPNTRVSWVAALIGGFAAGIALMFMHDLYLELQIGVARSNAIYATLAALPLLIVYLQLAWTIILVGAELGHAVQYTSLLRVGRHLRDPSPALRERLALALTDRAVQAFDCGAGGVELGVTATELDVPRSVLESVCRDLVRAAILSRTGRDRVLPSRPGEQISIDDVRRAIRGDLPDEMRGRIALSESIEQAVAGAESTQREALASVRFSLPV